uniref:Glycolipid transfer protein domain-containing protein n=1 Tax=Chromera velia CCMP2878 TaxID=1169474 RepID=A0A0G4HPA5_9ALVE|eukprot:Cvel_29686.t1-p1 / transcript=Cvel_29686.t1 / gene=Cvel_29686 / organism=Chromera_velia_CCMP2878 / gene_product=Glycolipid transfer protein, putative / transcript_product=Glycolipid transfer protein, putative / location=Cvel_scaffold4108:4413-6216(+) / protein_length=210 / sequence_SO=supercontig / SO=protein_coding / is_pseudo=false
MSDQKLDTTEAAFRACINDQSEIDCMKFAAAARSVGELYDDIFYGVVAGQLKKDIDSSATTVEKAFLARPDKETLAALMAFEMETLGRDKVRADKKTGTIGILWAKRAVQFVSTYLGLLIDKPEQTSGACASETYEKVLKPYHSWMVSGVVSMALSMAPSREQIFEKFGLGPDAAGAEGRVKGFLAVLNSVISQIEKLLEQHDANFPDTV